MSKEDKFGKGFLDELESLSETTEKKPKKTSSVDEVENLLKSTLSEVGINADKLRASVKAVEAEKQKEKDEMAKLDSLLEPIQKPPHETAHDILRSTVQETVRETPRPVHLESFHEPAAEKEPHVPPRPPERAEIFEKPKPTEKDLFPPLPEKKPVGARPAPGLHRDRFEAPAKKPDAVLDAYADKSKKKFPMAAVVIAAVVVIGAAAGLIVLNSGKGGTEARGTIQTPAAAIKTPSTPSDPGLAQNPPDLTSEAEGTPAAKPNPPAPANPRNANVAVPANKQAAPTVTTQTGPAQDNTGAPAEPIQPLVPVTNPRVQDVKPAATQAAPADSTAGRTAAANPTAPEPPRKAKLGDLVALDQVDTQPVVQSKGEAIYPPAGRRMGIEGTCVVNALISETGDVIRTNVIRKIPGGANYGFEQASEDAVKKWRFKPAVKDGVNVKTWMPVAIVFRK